MKKLFFIIFILTCMSSIGCGSSSSKLQDLYNHLVSAGVIYDTGFMPKTLTEQMKAKIKSGPMVVQFMKLDANDFERRSGGLANLLYLINIVEFDRDVTLEELGYPNNGDYVAHGPFILNFNTPYLTRDKSMTNKDLVDAFMKF